VLHRPEKAWLQAQETMMTTPHKTLSPNPLQAAFQVPLQAALKTALANTPQAAAPTAVQTATQPLYPSQHTQFLGSQALSQLIARVGVPQVLQGMMATMQTDFARWPAFDKSARSACHSPDGVIELMPIADAQHYSFKYVNGHPKNSQHRLPTVMAFGVLADVATGMPLLLCDLTLVTALRTAAASAMAAKALARKGSRVMALIGNGAQSEFQALAFHHLLGIDQLRVYDCDPQATDKLLRNLQSNPTAQGLRVQRCASTLDAVRDADIITTITADKTLATIITPDMVEPGMHLNAVGGDCPGKTEIHPDVVRHARVFTEFTPQTRVEGELQQMPADFAVTELWQVLTGQAPGRTQASEVTLFDSVGFALEDFSALRYVYSLAAAHRVGYPIDLIPQLADPKDLYQLLRGSSTAINPLGAAPVLAV
jgi:ornithine cyclodeaminase